METQETHQFSNNKTKQRFELLVDGHVSIIEYTISGKDIYLTHTEVPPVLEGKGVGTELVKMALENIKSTGMTLVPLCHFVAIYVKRHPEWNDIVKEGFKID